MQKSDFWSLAAVLDETVGALELLVVLLFSGRNGQISSSRVLSVLSKTLSVVYSLLLRLTGVGDCEWFVDVFLARKCEA